MLCPECEISLTAGSIGGAPLLSCQRCGGSFVRRADNATVLEEITGVSEGLACGVDAPMVVYRNCPVCGTKMSRRAFGVVSGVVLNECVHGVWFSAGQLQRVGAFLANGGAALTAAAQARRAEGRELVPSTQQRDDAATAALAVPLELLALLATFS